MLAGAMDFAGRFSDLVSAGKAQRMGQRATVSGAWSLVSMQLRLLYHRVCIVLVWPGPKCVNDAAARKVSKRAGTPRRSYCAFELPLPCRAAGVFQVIGTELNGPCLLGSQGFSKSVIGHASSWGLDLQQLPLLSSLGQARARHLSGR